MTKILHWGESPRSPGAYGSLTRKILGYQVSRGAKVRSIAWGENYPGEVDGIELAIGTTPIVEEVIKFMPDYIYGSNDYFTMQDHLLRLKFSKGRAKIVQYGIIDGVYCADEMLPYITFTDIPVCPTSYGKIEIERVCPGKVVQHIPHGVDLNVFKPRNAPKSQAVNLDPFENKFVIGSVNRNLGRKNIVNLLLMYKTFRQQYDKDNQMRLLLVTNPTDSSGPNLLKYCQHLGLGYSVNEQFVDADVRFISGINQEELVRQYQLMDVLVSTSLGEGFSLPTLEAMACNVPVLVPHHTAFPELVVDGAGLTYDVARYRSGSPVLYASSAISQYYLVPDLSKCVEGLLKIITGKANNEFTPRTVAERYSWDTILPQWNSVFV